MLLLLAILSFKVIDSLSIPKKWDRPFFVEKVSSGIYKYFFNQKMFAKKCLLFPILHSYAVQISFGSVKKCATS